MLETSRMLLDSAQQKLNAFSEHNDLEAVHECHVDGQSYRNFHEDGSIDVAEERGGPIGHQHGQAGATHKGGYVGRCLP